MEESRAHMAAPLREHLLHTARGDLEGQPHFDRERNASQASATSTCTNASETSVGGMLLARGRRYRKVGSVLLFLVPVVAFLITHFVLRHEGDFDDDSGISIGVIYGSALSILSSLFVVRNWHREQAWRRQHNTLLFYRTLADLFLALRLLLVPLIRCLDAGTCQHSKRITQDQDTTVCTWTASIFHWSWLASELWLGVIAYEIYRITANPFTEPRRGLVGRKRYHALCWLGAATVSVLLNDLADQVEFCFPATFAAQDCASHHAHIPRPVGRSNTSTATTPAPPEFQARDCQEWYYWAFSYSWILCIYVGAVCTLLYAKFLFQSGLDADATARLDATASDSGSARAVSTDMHTEAHATEALTRRPRPVSSFENLKHVSSFSELNDALSDAYESAMGDHRRLRQQPVLRAMARVLLLLLLAGAAQNSVSFVALAYPGALPPHSFVHELLLFFVASRGYIDFVVWFYVNPFYAASWAERVKLSWLSCRLWMRDGARGGDDDTKDNISGDSGRMAPRGDDDRNFTLSQQVERARVARKRLEHEQRRYRKLRFITDDELQFNAQLNTALQREVLYYTTTGIMQAARAHDKACQSTTVGAGAGADVGVDSGMGAPLLHANGADTDAASTEEEQLEIWLRPEGEAGALARAEEKDAAEAEMAAVAQAQLEAMEGDTSPQAQARRRHLQREQRIRQQEQQRARRERELRRRSPKRFISFLPSTFARIRTQFGMPEVERYTASLAQSSRWRVSSGKSGAFMFYTRDMRMLVKTISAAECRFLRRIAARYEKHLQAHHGSFLVKFFGLHCLSLYSRRFFFVVMGNHFPPKLAIHRTYDIKGSWEGRWGRPPHPGQRVTCRHCNAEYRYAAQQEGGAGTVCAGRVGGHRPNIVLKDNDCTERLRLSRKRAHVVCAQLCADADLLASFGATDYSMLLGVHNIEYDCNVDYTDGHDYASDTADDTDSTGAHAIGTANHARPALTLRKKAHTHQISRSPSPSAPSGRAASSASASPSPSPPALPITDLTGSVGASVLPPTRRRANTAAGEVQAALALSCDNATDNIARYSPSDAEARLGGEEAGGTGTADAAMATAAATASVKVCCAQHARAPTASSTASVHFSNVALARRVIGPAIYALGIVDVLSEWTLRRRLQRWAKSIVLRQDPNGVSAMEPQQYCWRFKSKIRDLLLPPAAEAPSGSIDVDMIAAAQTPRVRRRKSPSTTHIYDDDSDSESVQSGSGSWCVGSGEDIEAEDDGSAEDAAAAAAAAAATTMPATLEGVDHRQGLPAPPPQPHDGEPLMRARHRSASEYAPSAQPQLPVSTPLRTPRRARSVVSVGRSHRRSVSASFGSVVPPSAELSEPLYGGMPIEDDPATIMRFSRSPRWARGSGAQRAPNVPRNPRGGASGAGDAVAASSASGAHGRRGPRRQRRSPPT